MEDKIVKNKDNALIVLNIALLVVYSAFHDNDEAFFNEDYGKGLLSIIEEKTGHTLEMLKELYETRTSNTCEDNRKALLQDAKKLCVKELADKYGCSQKAIRSFLEKNGINPVRKRNKISETDVINRIKELNGQYSLTDISKLTNISFNRIKEICFVNNLPFKSSRVNIRA